MDKQYRSKTKLCYQAPFLQLLNDYYSPISEEQLFVLCQGLNFEFCYIHNNQKVYEPKSSNDYACIIGAHTDIIPFINRYISADFFMVNLKKKKLLNHIQEQLRKSNPVIILADVYHLKYHLHYQKVHAITKLIIYEICSSKYEYRFLDCHIPTIPTTRYEGIMTLEELITSLWVEDSGVATAYFANFSDLGGNNNYLVTDESYNLSINQNCQKLIENHCLHSGPVGLKHMAKEIENWDKYWKAESLRNVFRQAYFHISNRGGPTITRAVFAAFFTEENQDKLSLSLDAIQYINQSFVTISKNWATLAGIFFRGSLKDPCKYLSKIKNKSLELSEMEMNCIKELLYLLER